MVGQQHLVKPGWRSAIAPDAVAHRRLAAAG